MRVWLLARAAPAARRARRFAAVGMVTALGALGATERLAAAAAPPSEDDGTIVDPDVLGPPGILRARAERVSFDAASRSLELEGDVRVDGPPFHLRAQRIVLTRTRFGIDVAGEGQLAFCPCLGTPLVLGFDGAVVAPPGDLVLRKPSLRIYGVPVATLPYFWLRSEEKVGVLPPDLAYRGKDGVFVGGGVHVPWKTGDGRSALDLRAGAYVLRGVAADVRLRTPASTTRVRFDRLPSSPSPALPFTDAAGDDGLLVDARGATTAASGGASVAWDADVVRGRRGVASTTELEAAARPWDRAAIEGVLRGSGLAVSVGALAVSRRGGGFGDVEAAGPVTRVRGSGAAGSSGSSGSSITWDATLDGGALRTSGGASRVSAGTVPPLERDTVSFARVEAGLRAVTTASVLDLSLALRGAGEVAMDERRDGVGRAGSARLRAGVPLARAWAAEGPRSPLVHVVEPFTEVAVVHARGDALLGSAPGRGLGALTGTAPVGRVGVASSLGRWSSREAAELELSGGAAMAPDGPPRAFSPLVRLRASASSGSVGGALDGGLVGGAAGGLAGSARLRLGALDRMRVLTDVAHRGGVDPVLARALTDAPLEPGAGFLTRAGSTGGAALVIPWSATVTTSAGVDGDLDEGELVAARGGVELRDRCGCVTLRVLGSHRVGRPGVDVWLALDFAAGK